ncbi:CDAN1-interacting nuclease 1 isoform X1, partial [Lates japonicus]
MVCREQWSRDQCSVSWISEGDILCKFISHCEQSSQLVNGTLSSQPTVALLAIKDAHRHKLIQCKAPWINLPINALLKQKSHLQLPSGKQLSGTVHRQQESLVDTAADHRKMRLPRAEYKEIVRWTEHLRPTRQCMKMLKERFP